MIPLALSRYDVADYVSALIIVYIVLIFANILISWVPRMPYRPWLRSVLDFITETTNPYLNLFRRFLPPLGGGGFAIDLAPMLGVIVLFLARAVLVGLIEGVSAAAKRAWLLAAMLALAVLVCDQVAKAIAEDKILIGEQIEVLGPLEFTLTHNRGVAFGLAGGAGAPLILVTLVALGAVLFLFSRNPARPWMWVAVGLLAGGAIGNLVDRILQGHVTDFIDLPPWPPFNLADVAITFGVIALVILYLFDAGVGAKDEAAAERERG